MLDNNQNISDEDLKQVVDSPEPDVKPIGEPTASVASTLAHWGARALIQDTGVKDILKTAKPLEKEARKKVFVEPREIKPTTTTTDKVVTDNVTGEPIVKDVEMPPEGVADLITNAQLKDFKTTDSHQVNFDLIENGEDVTTTLAQMAEVNKSDINEARRGVVSDEMVRGLADDLGQDPKFIQDFLNREGGTAANAETVLATRQLLEQSAIRLKSLSTKIATHQATDLDKAAFAKQYHFHKQFQQQFMGMRAEFGRGLRAFGTDMGSMEQAKVNDVMGMVANDMSIDKIAAQIATMDTTKGVNQLVQKQDSLWTKGTKVFAENFISSILSGVKTQVVNTSGTALRLGMDIPDTLTAAWLGRNLPEGEEKVVVQEAQAKLFGVMNGFRDALHIGAQVAKTAEPYGGIDKLDMLHQKAISSEYLGFEKDSIAGKMVDTYGTIVRAPLERVMGATDGFFKALSERSQLAGLAYRKVAASGLEGDEAKALLKELMENPDPEMIARMEDYALDVTFQKPLGETGQAIQKAVNKSPVLKMFLPFIKTPTNLMKQAFLERSPIAVFSDEYKADVAAGGARAQMAKAKVINGTMMAMTAATLAMNGKMTGSNPRDERLRQARYASGWRPRSFVFENDDGTKEYVSWDRLEPFSYFVGMTVDIVEWQQQTMYDDPDEDADKQAENAVLGLVSAFAVNSLDKTFMTGIQSIMQALDKPQIYGKQYLAGQINAIAPFSGLRRDISKMTDDHVKEAMSLVEKLKKGLPSENKELPNKLDIFGNDMKFDTVLSPWPTSTSKPDKVMDEVLRVVQETRKVFISRPYNRIGGIKLSAQQYHDLVKNARKDLVISGKNFKETLQDAMSKSMYKNAPTDEYRGKILNTIQKKFDNAAVLMMQRDDKVLAAKLHNKKVRGSQKISGKDLSNKLIDISQFKEN